MKHAPPTLSPKDLANRWRVTPRTVRRWLRVHQLPRVQYSGKTILFFERDVAKLERTLRNLRRHNA